MKKFASFLAGSIMGGLVGATLVMLLTPVSGEVLREQILETLDRFQSEIKQAAQNKRAELESQLAELRQPHKPEENTIDI